MTRTMRGRDRMATRRRFLADAVAAVAAVAFVFPATARAQSLNDQRAAGTIGEGFDGFARARSGSLRSTVDAVNAKRRAIYAARAKERGTTEAQVGRVYAKEIMSRAPSGTWFLEETGQWVRK